MRSAVIRGLIACGICVASCIGDPTHGVSIHNGFGETIQVYTGQRTLEYRLNMAPGQTITQGWPYGWGPARRRIEAFNAAGMMVFCEIVITDDLGNRGWRIEVAPGHPSCE